MRVWLEQRSASLHMPNDQQRLAPMQLYEYARDNIPGILFIINNALYYVCRRCSVVGGTCLDSENSEVQIIFLHPHGPA